MNRCTIALLALALPATATARTIHTVGSGQAYATISEALSAASSGDIVEVSAGTYDECLFVVGDIKIHGVDGPGSTTLSCGDAGVSYTVEASARLHISGFTITHTAGGAGIFSNASSLVVSDVVLDGLSGANGGAIEADSTLLSVFDTTITNASAEFGGGLYVTDGNLRIWNTEFSGTSAAEGGAIYALRTSVEAIDVDITGASADIGGGIRLIDDDGTVSQSADLLRVSVDGATTSGNGAAVLSEQVPLTVLDSTFTNNASTSGSGGAIWTDASLWVQGSTFTGNTATSGGAVLAFQTSATLRANTFTDNQADPATGGFGGAVDGFDAELVTADNTWSSNSARLGGALFAGADWESFGDAFDGNSATENGGGAYAALGVRSLQSTFTGNSAGIRGGGLYTRFDAAGVTLILESCTISGNDALRGGGVYHAGPEYLTLRGCVVESNTATEDGGGMYVEQRAGFLQTTRVSSNSAARGGGLFFRSVQANTDAGFSIQSSEVSFNTAEQGGGAWVERGLFQVIEGWITDNQSTAESGGGAYLFHPSGIWLSSAILCNNASGVHGGGIYAKAFEGAGGAAPLIAINGAVFQENSAASFGGAVYEDGAVLNGVRTTFDNVTVIGNTSGIASYGGLVAGRFDTDLSPSRFTITDSVIQANGDAGLKSGGSVPLTDTPMEVWRTDFGDHTVQDVDIPSGFTWDFGGNFSDSEPLSGGLLTEGAPILSWSADGDCTNDLLFDQYDATRGAAAKERLYSDTDGDGISVAEGDCAATDGNRAPIYSEDPGNAVDEDCDNGPDFDGDGDGYFPHDELVGYFGSDCDDADASVNPDATDTAGDDIDEDCSGTPNRDGDGDTHPGIDQNGEEVDCDDTRSDVHLLGMETFYDGVDEDCDFWSDYDADQDGFDSDQHGGADCDDYLDTVAPGLADTPYDGIDTNCDGLNDYDADGDGYVSEDFPGTEGGSAPDGGDCNDGNSAIHPGMAETYYDGVDANCDGLNDFDADGDTYVREGNDAQAGGSAPNTGDCDDDNAATFPDAVEVCDGELNDCNAIGGVADADTDADGVLDYWEQAYGLSATVADSDGDGISDGVEWTLSPDGCLDNADGPVNTDGTDQIDALDTDSDNDRVPDSIEGETDTDSDGTADFRDPDDDGDGISTLDETNGTGAPIDTDGDGVADYLDLDSDDDGALDASESTDDTDDDGLADWRDDGSDADAAEDADPETEPGKYGFGCQSAPVAPSAVWLGLALLGLRRRREPPTLKVDGD